MEARSSPQLVHEGCVAARSPVPYACIEAIADSGQIEEVASRGREPIEIVADGEVLDDVALPGVDHAPIGLEPIGHSALPASTAVLSATICRPRASASGSDPPDRASP